MAGEQWFAFRGDRMLVFEDAPFRVPLAGSPDELGLDVLFRWEIGELDGHTCWAVEVGADARPPEGMVFQDLRDLFYWMDEGIFRMAVLVRRGDRILLAHSPGFPQGLYSVLAGFVEPGESIEEAVVREVREEVGIEVTNVRYFGSQPWPFPNSLMIGFTAD